LGITPYWQDL